MTHRELIPSLYVPVLLGDTAEHRRLARRLFWSYGLPCHLFDARFSPWRRLTPWVICHPLPSGCSSAICALALTDLAVEVQDSDRQAILLVDDTVLDRISPLTPEELHRLSDHYLICHEHQLFDLFMPPVIGKEEMRHD